MKLLIQVYVVHSFRCSNNTFASFFVKVNRVDWVVKVHSDKARIRLTLQNIGIVIPEIQISVTGTYDSSVLVASQVHYFATAHDFSPDNLKVAISHDDKLPFWRSTKKVLIFFIDQIIACCKFDVLTVTILLLIVWLDENIVIFELLVFGESPEMNLIPTNCSEF